MAWQTWHYSLYWWEQTSFQRDGSFQSFLEKDCMGKSGYGEAFLWSRTWWHNNRTVLDFLFYHYLQMDTQFLARKIIFCNDLVDPFQPSYNQTCTRSTKKCLCIHLCRCHLSPGFGCQSASAASTTSKSGHCDYSEEQFLQLRAAIRSYSGLLSPRLERVGAASEQFKIELATTFQNSNVCGGGILILIGRRGN